MWRTLLIISVLATLSLISLSGMVFAAAPPVASQTAVTMRGQVAVIGSNQNFQLRLKTTSTDRTGWLLEVSLNPTNIRADRNRTSQPIQLNGTFTLGIPQVSAASGTATGWIDNSGAGDIKLTDQNNFTSLDASFTSGSDGSVTAQVYGRWPAIPTSQPISTQPINHFFWYLSRTSGILAYILLFFNLCLGLILKSKFTDWMLRRWRTTDLHQFIGILTMALLGLHVFSLLGDSYFNYDLIQLLLPMASPYRPVWTAMGILAFYLILAAIFSFYFRKFIGYKTWHALHYVNIGLFFIILFHGIKAGTDSSAPWSWWLYTSTGTVVVFLILSRIEKYRLQSTVK